MSRTALKPAVTILGSADCVSFCKTIAAKRVHGTAIACSSGAAGKLLGTAAAQERRERECAN